MANKFKKGDNIIVITGSDKGKTGKILSISDNKAIIEGINIATIHQKPTSQKPGEIKKVEKGINISNISHVENGLPIKIKFVIEPSTSEKNFNNKKRVSKKTGKLIN
jgi:large subunit ribosomal protein L24